MSREYDAYLQEHKANVAKGFHWIRENLPELLEIGYGNTYDIEHQICFAHDASKTEADEYYAYDNYFYGGNRSYFVVQEFNHAWLNHIHRNPHHWQHWILVNDDPENGEVILNMPYIYILEMICDWWAFSWASGNLTEIFEWYEKHAEYMKLSDKTREVVVDILDKIAFKLREMAMDVVKESED